MGARIAYLPGDGIGPEVLASARTVAEAAGLDAEWIEAPVGWNEWTTHGNPLPDDTLALLHDTDACLFGAITSQPDAIAQAALPDDLRGKVRYQSPIVRIRRELGLAINVRPARFWPGVPSPLATPPEGHTITILRENTEDLYSGIEAHPLPAALAEALDKHAPGPRTLARLPADDTALTGRLITRAATEQLVTAAYAHATRHGHTTVTLAEKPNVMRATGGLVLDTAHSVAAKHPEIRLDVVNADALAARLVQDPQAFAVIAATNLFGDILSDLTAGLTGGLGLMPSANIGPTHALFEPVHGSAPDIAGTGRANPIAAILSAAMLAHHLGQRDVAKRIETAVAHVLAHGPHTPDLGGNATTQHVTDAVVAAVHAEAPTATTP